MLGLALGAGPPGLAHRVLGDERAAPRRALRHPRRRPGPASSRTTRTRSPSPRARTATPSSTTGCTTASCASTTRRCPSRSATSSPYARCWRSTTPRWCASSSLRAHYRSPLNYSDQHLDDARAALTRLYTTLRDTPPALVAIDWSNPHAARFREAMDDDFNTADAVRRAVRAGKRGQPHAAASPTPACSRRWRVCWGCCSASLRRFFRAARAQASCRPGASMLSSSPARRRARRKTSLRPTVFARS